MGKKLPSGLWIPSVEWKVTMSFQEYEIRYDLEARVPLAIAVTEKDCQEWARMQSEADLFVIEKGRIYGWAFVLEEQKYGPWTYSLFSLAYNGLSEAQKPITRVVGHDPSQGVLVFRELARNDIAKHLCEIYRRMGYHERPSWWNFREMDGDQPSMDSEEEDT